MFCFKTNIHSSGLAGATWELLLLLLLARMGQDKHREQRTEEISRDPVTGVGCSLLITVTLASRAADDPLRSLKRTEKASTTYLCLHI